MTTRAQRRADKARTAADLAAATAAKADRREPPYLEGTDLAIAMAELLVLWPRLEAALARDGSGPGDQDKGGGKGGTKAGSPAPLDLDVQAAIVDIAYGAAAIVDELGHALGYRGTLTARDRRGVDGRPNLAGLNDVGIAAFRDDPVAIAYLGHYQPMPDATTRNIRRIAPLREEAARRMPVLLDVPDRGGPRLLRIARSALLLDQRRKQRPERCPNCREAHLVEIGASAALHPAIIAGRPLPAGEEAITWPRLGLTVTCPSCHSRWHGPIELGKLGRLVEARNAEDNPPPAFGPQLPRTDRRGNGYRP